VNRLLPAAAAMVAALSACTARDVILPGERLDIRDGTAAENLAATNEALPLALPGTQANTDWTHRGGDADHRLSHPALPGSLTLAFATSVGEGNSRRARITADPVVAGGRVFALDARATVSAVSTGGGLLWQADLTPETDGRTDASGGGLATDGASVFATTGFGRLTRLDAATGAVIWTQDLDAPGNAAPTVAGDLVYVVGRDSRAWAIETETGRIRWQLTGLPAGSTFSGGAGVAVGGGLAVFPFPSGEVIGAFADGGLTRWSSVLAGGRPGQASGVATTDIAGDPVIDGDRLYVGNVAGRIVAMDLDTGDRIWTATEGAVSPVWPEGGSIFAVNDVNELVRLSAADGTTIWRVQLPVFLTDNTRRQSERYAHFGPVLAGGRLIVASSDGVIRQFDPVSGAGLGDIALPGGAASNPVVAGGTLYLLNRDGQLVAFR
jgi:outer membrane protein assembly factor BamB